MHAHRAAPPIAAFAVSAVLAACAPHAAAGTGGTRYIELVNRAHEAIVAIAIAPATGDDFRDVPLAGALAGGGIATTLQVHAAECVQHLRFTFRDGRTLVYRDLDLCRSPRIRVLPPHRAVRAAGATGTRGR